MEKRIKKQNRVSINVTEDVAERRTELLSKIFDHKVSASVAEDRILDIAEEALKAKARNGKRL
jgi:hypothetical protein